jgi:hypothetical protein
MFTGRTGTSVRKEYNRLMLIQTQAQDVTQEQTQAQAAAEARDETRTQAQEVDSKNAARELSVMLDSRRSPG